MQASVRRRCVHHTERYFPRRSRRIYVPGHVHSISQTRYSLLGVNLWPLTHKPVTVPLRWVPVLVDAVREHTHFSMIQLERKHTRTCSICKPKCVRQVPANYHIGV